MPQAYVPSCLTWIPPPGSLRCPVTVSPGTLHPIDPHPRSLSSFTLAVSPSNLMAPVPPMPPTLCP